MPENRFTEKAETSLHAVLEAFRDGTIAEKCAVATFPSPDLPAQKWSLNNRWLALIQTGEADCRGFRQWEQVGRKVIRGQRAAFILRPRLIKKKNPDTGKEEEHCIGFGTVAVFAAHQTEGEPLDYTQLELPDLPLIDVARAWDIDVSAQGFVGGYLGYFAHRRGSEERKIVLCTAEASTFFHELCHTAHERLRGDLKAGQDPMQEIVAELGAEILRRLLGSDRDTSGNSFAYIERYAEKKKLTVLDACLKALQESARVVGLILETAESCNQNGITEEEREVACA